MNTIKDDTADKNYGQIYKALAWFSFIESLVLYFVFILPNTHFEWFSYPTESFNLFSLAFMAFASVMSIVGLLSPLVILASTKSCEHKWVVVDKIYNDFFIENGMERAYLTDVEECSKCGCRIFLHRGIVDKPDLRDSP